MNIKPKNTQNIFDLKIVIIDNSAREYGQTS